MGKNPDFIESPFPEGSCSSGIHPHTKSVLLTLAVLVLIGLSFSVLVLEKFC